MSTSQVNAKIVADSINSENCRLTTFILTMPRIILSEFNTHRAISRNSASSRAVPYEKMLARVQENPFIPIKWMKDHSGMQGNEFFTEENEINILKEEWLKGRDEAVKTSQRLSSLGLTKQIVNRGLETYMWHTVIATGTNWENFFSLRAEAGAEIHIQELAYQMLEAYNASNPQSLEPGKWHIPFGDTFDHNRLKELMPEVMPDSVTMYDEELERLKVQIATARCARVSYFNFDGTDDYSADIKLHDRLAKSGHWSPFEHCAMAMRSCDFIGNFQGFRQYRKNFATENRKDERVIKKFFCKIH